MIQNQRVYGKVFLEKDFEVKYWKLNILKRLILKNGWEMTWNLKVQLVGEASLNIILGLGCGYYGT